MYEPIVVDQFLGLDTFTSPTDVGPNRCIDCLNVVFDTPGAVRQRPGFTVVDEVPAGREIRAIQPDGNDRLVVVSTDVGTNTTYLSTTLGAALTDRGSFTGASRKSTVAFGTPTASYVFVAGAGHQLWKLDSANALTTSPGWPLHVAVTPWDSRLAQANHGRDIDSPTGADGSEHTIFFSDPGLPDTYQANSFETLRPGDGEEIRAVVSWRDLLFVFKETAVYTFYGVSVDSTGQPIFNYRKLDLPSRLGNAAQPVAVGSDGVYYCAADGIYITSGDVPRRVSDRVKRFLDEDVTDGLYWAEGRLYVAQENEDVLVLDETVNEWTRWILAADLPTIPGSIVASGVGSESSVWFAANNQLCIFGRSGLGEEMPFESWYVSGFYPLADGAEAVVRQTTVHGYAPEMVIQWFTNNESLNPEMSADLPIVQSGEQVVHDRHAFRARTVSHGLYVGAASDDGWKVDRLIAYPRDRRAAR